MLTWYWWQNLSINSLVSYEIYATVCGTLSHKLHWMVSDLPLKYVVRSETLFVYIHITEKLYWKHVFKNEVRIVHNRSSSLKDTKKFIYSRGKESEIIYLVNHFSQFPKSFKADRIMRNHQSRNLNDLDLYQTKSSLPFITIFFKCWC